MEQQHQQGPSFNPGQNSNHVHSPGQVPYYEGRNHYFRPHPYNRHPFDGPNLHQFGPRGGGGFGPRGTGVEHLMNNNNAPAFPNRPPFGQEQQIPYNRPPLPSPQQGFHRFQRPPYIPPNYRPQYHHLAASTNQCPPYGDENYNRNGHGHGYGKNNVKYVDRVSRYAPQFMPPPQDSMQFQGPGWNGHAPPDSTVDPPYIPQRINHFPILQLYNKIESPAPAHVAAAVEDQPYIPQSVPRDMNRIITGYSKLKRGSTGSTSSLTSSGTSSVPEAADDNDEESEPVFQMEANAFERVIQNFLTSKAIEVGDIRMNGDNLNGNPSMNYTPTPKTTPKKQGPQEVDTIERLPTTTTTTPPVKNVTTEGTEVPSPACAPPAILTPHRLTKTKNGFYCDDEGFVDVYIYGCAVGDKAGYGIWFSDRNESNCAERLTKGLQTSKGATIQAAKEAIALLRKHDHFKVRMNTDSTFIYSSVRNWAVKVLNSKPNAPFPATSWDEFKYGDEIRQLCDQFVEVTVKWNLVSPKSCGIKKVKLLAASQFKTSTRPSIERHIKNFANLKEFCP